ncbi:hypothetical protein [Microcoleus sp. FACHB-1515]|nr:hypothetical protein [Microcoleus sp. FACHB-1515]
MLIQFLDYLTALQHCFVFASNPDTLLLEAIAADRDYLEVGGRW